MKYDVKFTKYCQPYESVSAAKRHVIFLGGGAFAFESLPQHRFCFCAQVRMGKSKNKFMAPDRGEGGGWGERFTVVVVVVFFTLTDRASTIPSNIRGCQSGTWSAGQKKIRGTSTKLQ